MAHYYQFYKPMNCVTALWDASEPTIMQYLTHLDMSVLRPVGRLDRDTEGLLILTDDGEYNQRMTHPDAGIEKEYFFWAMGEFNEEKQRILSRGVGLYGDAQTVARPAQITVLETSTLECLDPALFGKRREHILKNRPETAVFSGTILVTEGKKHEVKRILKSIGCYCLYLKRLRMGEVVLNPELSPGETKKFFPKGV